VDRGVMPHRQWTMPSGPAYCRLVDGGRVVMVGTLRAELAVALEMKYGARTLDELSAGQAAPATVAVTSGVWGVRGEHLDTHDG
jgi:hypothetical protein